ncbi:MAG: hypothetical protein P8X74_15450 [Reinekea sp.]
MRDMLLLTHFTGLVFGAGAGFSIFVIGFLSKKFPPESREAVLVSLFPLRYISYVGLLLLVVSGVQMAMPYYINLRNMPLFSIKILSVSLILLISLYGVRQMQLAKNNSPTLYLKRLGIAGKAGFALSLVTVYCAVYSFH